MNVESFCYLGLLRFPEQLEAVLALLLEDEKQQATSFLSSVKDVPRPELLQRWSKLRNDEGLDVHRNVFQRTGITLEDLPPSLREWLVAWVADQDG